MEAALARVQLVGCGERISVFGLLEVCPVSSGYCLGSCNWVITSEMEKIVYLSSSSTLTTHPKSMDKDSAALKGADCLIMTALTQTPTQMPDPMIGEFCRLVVETLKASGNVLVPCYPSGIIYDLFECLSQQMDMNGLTTVPLFFLSPVADSSLAYSNIMAEWLSTAKHNRVYLPEEPFVHGALQRGGRLKAFPSLEAEAVQSEYRQPCVVFCGSSRVTIHHLRHSHHLPLMLVWASRMHPRTCSLHPNWLITSSPRPFSAARSSSAPCSVMINNQHAQPKRSPSTACHHHHRRSLTSSASTRRRHSAKPRAAAGINHAKTTTLLALPATLAHGTQSGLSTTNSPSCHRSANPSAVAAPSRPVSNLRDARPSTTSQPHQLPLSRHQHDI